MKEIRAEPSQDLSFEKVEEGDLQLKFFQR